MHQIGRFFLTHDSDVDVQWKLRVICDLFPQQEALVLVSTQSKYIHHSNRLDPQTPRRAQKRRPPFGSPLSFVCHVCVLHAAAGNEGSRAES